MTERRQPRMHVLVVEDHPSLREILRIALASSGFQLCLASSAEEVADPPHRVPDVAVVDLSLPGVSGCELITRLREWSPDMGIVCFSGSDDGRRDALAAGANEFVLKGSDIALLIEAIRRCGATGEISA